MQTDLDRVLTLILMVLAVYRVSRMLALEDGPFDLFSRIRGRIDPDQKTWIGRGIVCVGCISFWIALILALIIGQNVVLYWLGIAGAVIALHLAVTK